MAGRMEKISHALFVPYAWLRNNVTLIAMNNDKLAVSQYKTKTIVQERNVTASAWSLAKIYFVRQMFCLANHFLRRGVISADSFPLQRCISFSLYLTDNNINDIN